MAAQPKPTEIIRILYRNYRGEVGIRHIQPVKIWFGQTEYHPTDQWLLDAFDIDKNAVRSFAMQDIDGWYAPNTQIPPET